MTATERKLVIQTAALGVLITMVTAFADVLQLLTPFENWLYDQRCAIAQYFTPPPTDRLVHLDVTDQDLFDIGGWPWPRSRLAIIIDLLHEAGARAIALDLVMPEPQQPRLELGQLANQSADDPLVFDRQQIIFDDNNLAAAMARANSVLLPLNFEKEPPKSPLYQAAVEELLKNLELENDQLAQQLSLRGFKPTSPGQSLAQQLRDAELLVRARREAMHRRVNDVLQHERITLEAMRHQLLPQTPDWLQGSPQLRLLDSTYDRVLALQELYRLTPNKAEAARFTTVPMTPGLIPPSSLARAAGLTGFVAYLPSNDGVLRSIPLLLEHEGHLFPQMGVALACRMLGADLHQIQPMPDRLVIPYPGGSVTIPVRNQNLRADQGGMVAEIPWFGQSEWTTMYDLPRHEQPVQHMPINIVWQVHDKQLKIVSNIRQIDDAAMALFWAFDRAKGKAYLDRGLAPDDLDGRLADVKAALAEARDSGWVEAYQELKPEELDVDGRKFISSYHVLEPLIQQTQQLLQEYHDVRGQLRTRVMGRAVLLGWTATGSIADFVPTSLHPRCPGVVAHGVIFNAIMTGELWQRAPAWITLFFAIAVGLLSTAGSATLPPTRATLWVLLVIVGYLTVNFIVLFDWRNLIVGAAGPVTAAGLSWAGCTVHRFVMERRERARITKRFSSYADSALVQYVIEHPEQAKMDGDEKELSVVFTDLAGFTTISERLGKRTVQVLSEYLELMVPVIKNHHGYVNKFLGDGIMFFYGAPYENQAHACDAVATVLRMQEILPQFNATLQERNLPRVHMRAGIASGLMVVGDSGIDERSDYTVLGDTVNLSARLESANKATGTWIMVNQRTRELIGDHFLVRPVGKLQVVGKSEGISVYEPLAFMDQATDAQKTIARLTAQIVEQYQMAQFEPCLAAIDQFEAQVGQTKLTDLYRKLCQHSLREPPTADFTGVIVLDSK